MGLSTVYGIVKASHGFISVESQVGEGTKFHVYFPLASEQKILKVIKQAPEQLPNGNGETVLVIEDETSLAQMVSITLDSHGYKTIVASNGVEGVELYRKQNKEIDLVMTDMDLPEISGHVVFQRILKMNPEVKLIFTSGFVEPEMKSRMYSLGAKDFLEKPYQLGDVLVRVRKALD
jgi:CheY-like chemotaxis protein